MGSKYCCDFVSINKFTNSPSKKDQFVNNFHDQGGLLCEELCQDMFVGLYKLLTD